MLPKNMLKAFFFNLFFLKKKLHKKTLFFSVKNCFYHFLKIKKTLHTKTTQPLHTQKISQSLDKKSHNLSAKKIITQPTEKNKSCNLSELVSETNHATSPHTQTMQPLHAQNHTTF